MRMVLIVTLVIAALVAPVAAHADALDDGMRRVGLQLQCPVCEGENVADSPSGLANDMRSVIRTRLGAGESDEQILDEFVASYGDGILSEPPKRGISLGVWLGPVLGVGLGAITLVLLLRMWRRAPGPEPHATAIDADVVSEYHRFRKELGQ